jgi:hypothetical protein
LHPFLGFHSVTKLLDFLYFVWVLLCPLYWTIAFSTQNLSAEEKHQYLLATLASWIIIGVFAATYFASGGPIYYHEITGDSQMYAGLLEYLGSFQKLDTGELTSALMASEARDYLWQVHVGTIQTPGGISAMPSMHIAQAILFVFVTYKLSRFFGHLTVVYAIAIYLGSIHLAWHYAVDGIIAAIFVVAIWFISGWLTGVYKSNKSTVSIQG